MQAVSFIVAGIRRNVNKCRLAVFLFFVEFAPFARRVGRRRSSEAAGGQRGSGKLKNDVSQLHNSARNDLQSSVNELAAAAAPAVREKLTFWQKILRLFGLY